MALSNMDLELHPDLAISDKILSVSQALFDTVKNAPLEFREHFPSILKKNNFGLALRVTRQYAFLEVTSKLKAKRHYNLEREKSYRQLFTAKDSDTPAIFGIENAKFCRFSNINTHGGAAFRLGKDFSLCTWNLNNYYHQNGNEFHQKIDLLYVVGFGKEIYPENAWQEFDSLIRVTLSDWQELK